MSGHPPSYLQYYMPGGACPPGLTPANADAGQTPYGHTPSASLNSSGVTPFVQSWNGVAAPPSRSTTASASSLQQSCTDAKSTDIESAAFTVAEIHCLRQCSSEQPHFELLTHLPALWGGGGTSHVDEMLPLNVQLALSVFSHLANDISAALAESTQIDPNVRFIERYEMSPTRSLLSCSGSNGFFAQRNFRFMPDSADFFKLDWLVGDVHHSMRVNFRTQYDRIMSFPWKEVLCQVPGMEEQDAIFLTPVVDGANILAFPALRSANEPREMVFNLPKSKSGYHHHSRVRIVNTEDMRSQVDIYDRIFLIRQPPMFSERCAGPKLWELFSCVIQVADGRQLSFLGPEFILHPSLLMQLRADPRLMTGTIDIRIACCAPDALLSFVMPESSEDVGVSTPSQHANIAGNTGSIGNVGLMRSTVMSGVNPRPIGAKRSHILSWPQAVVDEMVDRVSPPTDRMRTLCATARVAVFVLYIKLSQSTSLANTYQSDANDGAGVGQSSASSSSRISSAQEVAESCFYYPMYVIPMFPIEAAFTTSSSP